LLPGFGLADGGIQRHDGVGQLVGGGFQAVDVALLLGLLGFQVGFLGFQLFLFGVELGLLVVQVIADLLVLLGDAFHHVGVGEQLEHAGHAGQQLDAAAGLQVLHGGEPLGKRIQLGVVIGLLLVDLGLLFVDALLLLGDLGLQFVDLLLDGLHLPFQLRPFLGGGFPVLLGAFQVFLVVLLFFFQGVQLFLGLLLLAFQFLLLVVGPRRQRRLHGQCQGQAEAEQNSQDPADGLDLCAV